MDRTASTRTLKLLILAAAGLAGAATASISCSDPESPCETIFQNECNTPCTGDATCANGLYCGPAGKCTADCTVDGGQCDGTCDVRGRCFSENSGSTGAFSGGTAQFMTGGTGTSSGCADLTVNLEPQTPTVLLLVDQSGSMDENFPGGTRWTVLYDVLMDPNGGVVRQLEDGVRFGLAMYTGSDNQCPQLDQVNIALGNYDEIDAVYGPAEPEGDTPTGESLQAVTPELLAFAEPGQKIIVLATDGEPDTCAQPNPDEGQAESIAAAQAAFQQGILTYIIAVGEDVSAGHQQDVANAGRGLPLDHSQGDAPFYTAANQQDLVDAFNAIISGVQSCIVAVNGTLDPANACAGKVYIDGMEIPCNDPNGWHALGPNSIELVGSACETLSDGGNHSVSGTFPCDVFVP